MKIEKLDEFNAQIWIPEDDLENPMNFKSTLDEFKNEESKTVLLDLTEKEWLSSSEIGVVMFMFKELDSAQMKFCLIASSEFVLKTIKLTGVDQLLQVFGSRDEALSELS